MKRLLWLGLLALFVGALAACGGGGEATRLVFEGNDSFQFSPSAVEVKAGSEVEVEFNNLGALQHSWVLVPAGVDLISVSEADAINDATTGIVPPGESRTISFTAPEAGTYQYVCTVPGHAAAGMIGTFTVIP